MSDKIPSSTFLSNFNIKATLGIAAGILAITAGLNYISFKSEQAELEKEKQIFESDDNSYKNLSDEEKFKQIYSTLIPIVNDCEKSKSFLPADAVLMVQNLIRIACKDECQEQIISKRFKRREYLSEGNYLDYTKTLLSESLVIRSAITACLTQLLSKLKMPLDVYQQSLVMWGSQDPLIAKIEALTINELSRLVPVDFSGFEHVTRQKYKEIRTFSFEKYKNFEQDIGCDLIEKVIGKSTDTKDRVADEGILTINLMRRIATLVKNSISDDLTFEEYGFEREELAVLGSMDRSDGVWDEDKAIKELQILFRLAIQEDKMVYDRYGLDDGTI